MSEVDLLGQRSLSAGLGQLSPESLGPWVQHVHAPGQKVQVDAGLYVSGQVYILHGRAGRLYPDSPYGAGLFFYFFFCVYY